MQYGINIFQLRANPKSPVYGKLQCGSIVLTEMYIDKGKSLLIGDLW